MADESRSADDQAANAAAEPDPSKKRKGGFSRFWNWIFLWGKGEDFEKRLQSLSKEEAVVHARMKRRAQGWRKMARNVVVCSVVAELFAVIFAIISTREEDLDWQMRALRVLPMFLLPGLSYVVYSALASFTRMRDRKDQNTLEKLRAERQTKIDELKERTNYYSTQQLIQKYDLDPAAKAAAATVLASKLGAESGLKFLVGDESKNNQPSGRSRDVEVVPTDGLRNRKISGGRSISPAGSVAESLPLEGTHGFGFDVQQSPIIGEQFVEHYKGPGANEGGWIARLAAMLVGEDPTQSYALICGNCRMHNGLARKEDFPYVTYYCPHCHALNGHRHTEGHGLVSSATSRSSGSPASGSAEVTPKIGSSSSALTETEATNDPPTVHPVPHAVSDPTEMSAS